jgi:hypothetical protein
MNGNHLMIRFRFSARPPPSAWSRAQPGPSTVQDPLNTALTEYQSPNSTVVDNTPPDPVALAELERLRGIAKKDEEVHKALRRAIRKDKEIHAGMAIEISDPVGDETHEIRYWETTHDPLVMATANELSIWLAGRLIIRNP